MTTIVIEKLESPRQESDNNNHQSLGSVTRTSDDSIRHYTSASESPFFTTSSVSRSSNNLINDTPTFSSFSANSFLPPEPSSNHIESAPNQNSTSSASTFPSDTNIIKSSPQMHTYSISQDIVVSPKHTKENTTFNLENTEPIKSSSLPSEEAVQNLTSLQNIKREKTPLRCSDASSISPHPTGTNQTKVTRPSSSSASSATIGLAVTPISQSRIINNSDKPPGNQSQTSESSAFVAFQNNNNNKNIFMPLENTSRNHSLAISDIQHNMKKMALNEDLEQLKRTVDRMQQQRVSDREEHLSRVKEQKLREKEILEQINLTKQRLEMAIAGKFFMEDLTNTNDADNNAITATIGQQQTTGLNSLQPSSKGPNGPTIEEEYISKTNPIMKPSTSASSSKSKSRVNLTETSKPLENFKLESGRPKGLRKQPNSNNRHSNHHESPVESYFPDASKTDFEYLNNPHNPPPQQNFASNKFRYGNVRNYHPEMEYMEGRNRYDLFDPPRTRNMRNLPQQQRRQRSKSVESQWLPPQEFMDHQQHMHRLQQQQYELSYSPAELGDGNRFVPPGRVRSRKSSTHSVKSNPSEGTGNGQDLHNGYHSAAEKDDDDDGEDAELENDTNRHGPSGANSRYNPDGDLSQQYHDDIRLARNNSGNRYRRRPLPHSNNGPMPHSMMYHNQAFVPPPHMSHMGMMNDRERLKMRPHPPPPYGYNNIPPPGSEYYPYIPQRLSPRMMSAFNEDQQWNPPPPHHPQWGPGNQNLYGAPPPQPENIGNGAANNNGAVNGGVNGHHLQDTPNETNFGRRYPPAQAAPLQQTPQQPQHGYMGIYPDTPHRLYI